MSNVDSLVATFKSSPNEDKVHPILLTGTHKSEFQGIAPTNNKITYKGIQVYKIEGDELVSVYAVDDDLTMLTQLGLELK